MKELHSYKELAEMRKSFGLTQDYIAKQLDVSRQTINNNERKGSNKRTPLLMAYNIIMEFEYHKRFSKWIEE